MAAFALTFAGVAAFAGSPLSAQSIAGFNSDQPVNYAADRIELQDRSNRVVLSGDVVIDQGDLRLTAERTIVNYSDTGTLRIQRIAATGGVRVMRATETASGDVGVYDFNRRIITLTGDVALRRGSDTLNGERLTIDLNTGVSSVNGSTASSAAIANEGGMVRRNSGRVTGSFSVPKQ
ncbi:LptA/OstA family protein [Croceicoccus hydrothermalis]|uniref:LptA/OstA family protein n=1 Tax=Croceicoccus hydrothermalis TaxID=2867964 RepID=UPI001EFA67BF